MSAAQVERYVFETLTDTAKKGVSCVKDQLELESSSRDSRVGTEYTLSGSAKERLFAKRLLSCACCLCVLYVPVVMGDGVAVCKDCAFNMKVRCGSEVEFGQGTCTLLNELVQLCYPTAYEASKSKHTCNDLYDKGLYTEARDAYTSVLDKTPDSAALWLNRATAHLELKDAHKALSDANKAITLCAASVHYPSGLLYVKAMYRKGAAYYALEKYEEAVTTLSILLAWQSDEGSEAMLKQSIHALINTPSATTHTDKEQHTDALVSTDGADDRDQGDVFDATDMDYSGDVGRRAENTVLISCETDLYGHPLLAPVFGQLADTEGMFKGMFQGYTQKDLIHVDNACLPLVREKLDCPVCYQLLYQPTTLPCGHTLCRPCVGRTLDQAYLRSPSCPMCRSSLGEFLLWLNFRAMAKSAVGDHSEYVHYLSAIHTTQVIQTLIETYFESEYRERVEQYQRDENGVAQTDTIAIFCDTIMLPGTSATMEVFEPRYRLMIRRCIDSGSRAFGTMNSMDDKYGGLVSMTSYKQRPDGTSIIEVTGTKTFKVQSFGSRDGYTIASVLWPSEDGTWPQETDNESGAETAVDVDSVVAESGSDEDEADMLDISSIPSLRNLAFRTEAGAETNADQTAAQIQQSLQTATNRILADMRSNVQSLLGHPLLSALVTGGGRQPPPTDDEHFLNWCMSLTIPSRMQYELVFGETYRDNYHLRVGVVHLLWQRAVVHILSTFGPARSGATIL